MINGLAMQTTSPRKAVDYLTGDSYYDRESKEWKDRDPAPVVLEGDPKSFVQDCEVLTFKNKYTSGVLSFSPEETALINSTPGLKDEILQDFKDFAFAGIPDGCRNMLAVQHAHTGRLEIHYTIPRVNLESGKYWNPFEPNYDGKRGKGNNKKFCEQNDAYIDHACNRFGLQNPRDLSVARDIKISAFDKEWMGKRDVHKFVSDLVISGHINCREDIEKYLKQAGGTITRNGEDYISVKFGGDQKAMRFRGGVYDKNQFGAHAISKRELHAGQRPSEELTRQEFQRVMEERTERVENRHGKTEVDIDRDQGHSNEFDSGFSEYTSAIDDLEKASADIHDIKSAVADFVNNNSGVIAEYKDAAAEIESGVDVSDIAIAKTDDPVIRFFLQLFKQQAQAEAQRAMAASKKIWGAAFVSPESDKLLLDRVGTIYKAMLGIQTGINVDRPGRLFDYEALAHGAAIASDLARQRAIMLEHDRKQYLREIVAVQMAARLREQRDTSEQAPLERERRELSWKRGRENDSDDYGLTPGSH